MEKKIFNFEFRYSTGQYEYVNATAEMTIDEAVDVKKALDFVFKSEEEINSLSPDSPNENELICEICSGTDHWDNRLKKTNPKAPDFRCKNCQASYWESTCLWKKHNPDWNKK